MSKNQFAIGLVALLFLSAAITAALSLTYAVSTRNLRRAQIQIATMNNRLNLAQALLNDTVEYGKRNPAIDPLLQSLNLKTNPASASGPVARPGTK